MSEWQPIETAPKDVDLLGITPRGRYRVGRAFAGGVPRVIDSLIDGPTGRFWKCTHWMPLPEPPKWPEPPK